MATRKLTSDFLQNLQRWNSKSKFSSVYRCYSDVRELTHVLPRKPPVVSAAEAVKVVESKNVVFLQTATALPRALAYALAEHGQKANLKDVYVFHGVTSEPLPILDEEMDRHFRFGSVFLGPFSRQKVKEGKADYLPIFLSDVATFFRDVRRVDVALVQVSPPDKHGFCSLGICIDTAVTIARTAKHVIGLINPKMPRTLGDGIIHVSQFHSVVEDEYDLIALPKFEPNENDQKIAKNIADNLVTDRATLQFGIGSIPDAIATLLKDRKDLGVHTEMLGDGVMDLIEAGCITNAHKKVMPGKSVATFCVGSQKLYDFVDDNPSIYFGAVDWVNNSNIIGQNPNMVTINSCIEIDLTGQIVSDSIGTYIYSGVGGQVDFMRGGAQSPNGKPVIVLNATTSKGESRIVPFVKQGAGVVTSRADVHWVVTEHGICNLFGLPIHRRAYELIRLAHPDHRENLEKEAFKILGSMPCPPY